MIPVFKKLEIKSKENALSEIAEHINELQKEIYECFLNLSSDNIQELNLDLTELTSSQGSIINGDLLTLKGKFGETIKIGYDKVSGTFGITHIDKDGNIVE